MRTSIAAASLLLAACLPARADTYAPPCAFLCAAPSDAAVGDDAYPPGNASLPPDVAAQVEWRHGMGLSLTGYYNDPSLVLDSPPPRAAYVDAPQGGEPVEGYGGYGRPRGHWRHGHIHARVHFHAGFHGGMRYAGGVHFGASVHIK